MLLVPYVFGQVANIWVKLPLPGTWNKIPTTQQFRSLILQGACQFDTYSGSRRLLSKCFVNFLPDASTNVPQVKHDHPWLSFNFAVEICFGPSPIATF